MVYVKRVSFKSGVTPNPMLFFDMQRLTATQRLTFARCRIWNTMVNTGKSTGVNEFRFQPKAPGMLAQHNISVPHALQQFPFLYTPDYQADKLEKEERQKARVLMRGIKIGIKKGGKKVDIAKVVSKLK